MDLRTDPRTPTNISARLRHDGGWDDASILNISRKGLMFRARPSLKRGAFVEIRRGPHVIVAQVMWCEASKAGALAQDVISVQDLIKMRPVSDQSNVCLDRRRISRSPDSIAQNNRQTGQLIERLFAWAFVVFTCIGASSLAFEALSKPLAAAQASLAGAAN